MIKFGIDISRWQGNFNLSAAKDEGVSFVVLKGGGGDDGLYKDGNFERFYSDAKKLNIPVGAYWFSRALTTDEAIKEADFFIDKVLKNKQFELPVFIDVEDERMISLGKTALTKIVDTWCSYLESKGFFVGIYSTVYAFSAYMNDAALKKYTHWVAQWAKECTYPDRSVLGFWQFGGDTNLLRSNKIAGVTCDQNYMYFDFTKAIKDNKLNGFSDETNNGSQNDVPVSAPPQKSIQELAKEVIIGKWGVGTERKKLLTEAGYDYSAIQSLVNKMLIPQKAPNSTEKPLRAGDLAYISPDALIYGTDKRFADFIYKNLLYIRELDGDRAVISILPEGPVTGAVDTKYLSKYKV